MDLKILLGLILSFAPGAEGRWGLVLIVPRVLEKGLSVWPYFILSILLNILAIIVAYLFLDFLHDRFMRFKPYNMFMGRYINFAKKRGHKLEHKMHSVGYLALLLFVAIPFSGTGAWTATLISWLFGFNRKKSFIYISIGVIIASTIALLALLGFFGGFFGQF
jgi:uncharacterized membrane protein